MVAVKVFCDGLNMYDCCCHTVWSFSFTCLSHQCVNVWAILTEENPEKQDCRCYSVNQKTSRQILGNQASHAESAGHAASQGDRRRWALNLKNWNVDRVRDWQTRWQIFLPTEFWEMCWYIMQKKNQLSQISSLYFDFFKMYSFLTNWNMPLGSGSFKMLILALSRAMRRVFISVWSRSFLTIF